MARKNGLKNDSSLSVTFNSRTKAVMADATQDNIKEKVNAVRELVNGKSNNEIILVLQFYDYDVEKTIQAYLEDGAKEALQEWRHSGAKPVKKRKNKKKTSTASSQATDDPKSPPSIPSDPGSPTNFLVNGEVTPQEPVLNGVLDSEVDVISSSSITMNGPTTFTYQASDYSSPTFSHSSLPTGSTNHYDVSLPNSTETGNQSLALSKQLKPVVKQTESSGSQVKDTPHVKVTADLKVTEKKDKEKSPSPQPQRQHHQSHHQGHHQNRQRSHSGSHGHAADGRDRTTSTSSIDGKSGKKPAHLGLERSAKDLHRQTVSLERLRLIFNEEIDKSYKRIKTVFDEVRACLHTREELLMGELNSLKEAGGKTFNMRQGLAHDLKVKIDRAERMNEAELAELRVEIKHFVSDRKIDEDLAKTTRFVYDDQLKQDIDVFGEVVPLKCQYIQRRASESSVASSVAISEPDNHIPKSSIDTPVPSVSESDKKPTSPHLDPDEAHEIAELQKRLKHSLNLEGIPVETYPDRPSTAPVSVTSTDKPDTGSRPVGSARRNNRNRRRNDRERRPRQEGASNDNRVTVNQAPGGERVILIGRKTGPQGGSGGRPPRGGRGRGRGGSGRGRGGNSDVPRENNADRHDTAGNTRENKGHNPADATPSGSENISPRKPLPPREGSGSPRRGSGRGRGQGRRGNSNPGSSSRISAVTSNNTNSSNVEKGKE